MRIGIKASGGVISSVPTPFNINTFIILGSSIEVYAFVEADTKALIDSTYGVTSTVKNIAVSGWTTSSHAANIVSKLAALSYPNGSAIVFVGSITGNNITSIRPFTTAQIAAIAADYDTIYNAIIAKGYIPVFSDTSFRDYDSGECWWLEDKGSLPYNKQIVEKKCIQYSPLWCFENGESIMQYYQLTHSRPNYLSSDGIHPTATGLDAIRKRFVDTIVYRNYIDKKPHYKSLLRSAKYPVIEKSTAYISFFTTAADTYYINSLDFQRFGNRYGYPLPYTLTASGFTTTGASGGTTGNNSGFLRDVIFANNYYTATTGTMSISGLDDTKKYTIKVSGSRGGVSELRTTDIVIGGVTKTYQTTSVLGVANTADGATFTGLVPLAGVISITVNKNLGTYAHVSGLYLIEE